jgi:hypothetical protein
LVDIFTKLAGKKSTKLPFLAVATTKQASYTSQMIVQLSPQAASEAHTSLDATVSEEASTAQALAAADICRPSSA